MSNESGNSWWERAISRLPWPKNRWQWAGWMSLAFVALFTLYLSILYLVS
jgi:hypothetical protein